MHRIAHRDVGLRASGCWHHRPRPGSQVRAGTEWGWAGAAETAPRGSSTRAGRCGAPGGTERWCLSLVSPRSKNLTWRDMQHLVVQTSKPAHLNANDWVTNGVGRKGTGVLGMGQGLPVLQAPLAWGCWAEHPGSHGAPSELCSMAGHA